MFIDDTFTGLTLIIGLELDCSNSHSNDITASPSERLWRHVWDNRYLVRDIQVEKMGGGIFTLYMTYDTLAKQ